MEQLFSLSTFSTAAIILGAIFFVIIFIAILYRRVVPTNMVHIVQSSKKTISYGTGKDAGNVYYDWPSWIPGIGVAVIKLPVSNFDLSLKDYEAYDKDRVPFVVDVTAFFRISDTTVAAQRVTNINELNEQLHLIVQGAVRKVLASDFIDAIMLERSKFGDEFTQEVKDQLAEWGIESVKSMELMDIRDVPGSKVIANIMAKKTSHIEMESRKEVAENMRAAKIAEIEAEKEVDIRQQAAELVVGEKTADKDKAVGIAQEKAKQDVLAEEKETKTRSMEVLRVEQVQKAEITKAEQIVAAEQNKQTAVIISEGALEAKKNEAAGIEVEGAAKAEAEKLMQLAPVQAQITLAKEIGENSGYQSYLISVKEIDMRGEVGKKQAEALKEADVKIIANAGDPVSGMNTAMDLLSAKGGTHLASALEGLSQSEQGAELLKSLFGLLQNFTLKKDQSSSSEK